VDIRTGLAAALLAVLLYVGVRAFWTPIRWGLRLLMNAALGALGFYAWNRWIGHSHWVVGINPVTAGAVGLLGVPGFMLVLAMKILLST
jgi:inhibitor of the pro-sigma K processing machinery